MRHFISLRIIGVVVLVGSLTAGAVAFTASSTISPTFAGSGTSHMSGYTVSNDTQTLGGIDAINGKSFDLNGPANNVMVQFIHNGTPFGAVYSGHLPAQVGDACVLTPTKLGSHVQCTFSPSVSLTQATDVAISATQ